MNVAPFDLEVADDQFLLLADNLPTLCWMADKTGWIFWYNKRWYEYTGTTLEGMRGWGWQSVHDPDVLPRVLKEWRGCIARVKPFEMVFPLLSAGGKFEPFLTRVTPVMDLYGSLKFWFGTNTNVSELMREGEVLREINEGLRAELEGSRT